MVAVDPQHLRRIVRQHAMTARLLGVDFVPVFRRSGSELAGLAAPAATDPLPETRSAAVRAAPPSAPGPVPGAPTIEAKPAPRVPAAGVGRDRAGAQALLDEVRARYEKDAPHRKFVTAFTNIVFGEGDPCARLMFIGEAPGADEDATGRPFVDKAGQLLNKMITAMGLQREEVYITNVLKTRPPNNATPTSDEAAACAPYLFDQIAIVKPEVIVTLGLPASRLILASEESMGRLRGRWHSWTGARTLGGPVIDEPIAVMPTYHPAFLLRSYTPDNRAKVWADLQLVMQRLGLPEPKAAGRAAAPSEA